MNDFNQQFSQLLNDIEQEMQRIGLWQVVPPKPDAFLSEHPFAIDTMHSYQWLQWIFLPRMRAIIDANGDIPRNFSLHPYFEECLKEDMQVIIFLQLIKKLDELVKA